MINFSLAFLLMLDLHATYALMFPSAFVSFLSIHKFRKIGLRNLQQREKFMTLKKVTKSFRKLDYINLF